MIIQKLKEDKRLRLWAYTLLLTIATVAFYFFTAYSFISAEPAPWKQYIMNLFYFTFISNFMGLILAAIIVVKDPNGSKWFSRFKIMTLTNMTITVIVYWILLGPSSWPTLNVWQRINTIFVHGITPVVIAAMFFADAKVFKKGDKLSIKETVLSNLLFPLIWIIIATSLYYIFGGQSKDALYSFVRFSQNAWWYSVIVMVAIALAYVGFTALFTKVYNPK